MKKVLSLVLVLAMVLGTFSFAFAASDDITGHDNEAAIRRLVDLGLVKGDAQGYRPDDTLTRAEAATLVVRALGKEKIAGLAVNASAFSDVSANHWAAGYINLASKLGYVNGYPDGTFKPANTLTYNEALAMMVKVLGYAPKATQSGGWPLGYVVVADELDITDDTMGFADAPTTRANMFQMLENSLEEPMMIQVGFGDDAKWVVSGEEDTNEKTILDEIGFEKVVGRMIERANDDNEIVLEDEDGKTHDLVVADDFDSEANVGLELTAWVDGDEVITFKANDEAKFDATTGAEDEITLVVEDEEYEVAKDAVLVLDGDDDVKAEDFDADYAKVVLNDDDEIVWAEGYTFKDFMVVEEEDDDVVYSYDDDELDVEDYTIVKDGATIASADLEEGDILFFNEDEAYAVVYNNSEDGELGRVYTDSFKFEGDVYSYKDVVVRYLDGDTLEILDSSDAENGADILDAMKDEGDVEVFFNFAGDAILVVGDAGEVETDYFYGLVSYLRSYTDNGRKDEKYYALDVLNEEGKVVEYDLLAEDVKDFELNLSEYVDKDGEDTGLANTVVKVIVDEDGDVTDVEAVEAKDIGTDDEFEIDDNYAKGYRLQDDAVVFMLEDDEADDYEDKYAVFTWADAADEFNEVEKGTVYVGDNGRVVAIVATDTDAAEATAYTGLVTNVRELSSGDYEVTIEIAGEEFEYISEDEINDDIEDTIVTIKVNDNDEIVSVDESPRSESNLVVDSISTAKRTITVTGDVYDTFELVDNAVIYDEDLDAISLRDVEEKDKITVYFVDEDTERFVDYVLVGERKEKEGSYDKLDAGVTYTGTVEEVDLFDETVTFSSVSDEDGEALELEKNPVLKVTSETKLYAGDASDVLSYVEAAQKYEFRIDDEGNLTIMVEVK